MKAIRTRHLSFLLSGAAALNACGDPLATDTYRGDPLFGMRGQVTQALEEPAPTSDLEVGVLWFKQDSANDLVYIEASVASGIGSTLPAVFSVDVLEPPSEAVIGFENRSDIESVAAAGYLVVAPAGSFARFPITTSTYIDGELVRDLERRPEIANLTYASPFKVYYKPNELEKFSVVNDTDYLKYARYNGCSEIVWGENQESPALRACDDQFSELTAQVRADEEACLDLCPPDTEETVAAREDCQISCGRASQSALLPVANCYGSAVDPLVEARCGTQDFASTPSEVDPNSINLTIAADTDVRDALVIWGLPGTIMSEPYENVGG
jgi:hypothetical protein